MVVSRLEREQIVEAKMSAAPGVLERERPVRADQDQSMFC